MIFSKGQTVLYQDELHTIVEANYLGVRVQNDETEASVFIRASETEKVLMHVEELPIKPVEHKLFPVTRLIEAKTYWQNTKHTSTHAMSEKNRRREELTPGRASEVGKMNGRAKRAAINSKQQETPIEVLRERSRAMMIKE